MSDFIFQFFLGGGGGGGGKGREWCFCGIYGLMRGFFLWGIGCCRGRNSICRCRSGESKKKLDEWEDGSKRGLCIAFFCGQGRHVLIRL